MVVLMDGFENNVGSSRKVEQPSRYYFQFLFELCCRVRRLSSETGDSFVLYDAREQDSESESSKLL